MNNDYKPAWDRLVDNAMRSNNYTDKDQAPIWAANHIAALEAAIDAAQAVANSYYGTENEEFEPLIDALADALAALRGKP